MNLCPVVTQPIRSVHFSWAARSSRGIAIFRRRLFLGSKRDPEISTFAARNAAPELLAAHGQRTGSQRGTVVASRLGV